jgi:hypothetical protein
VKILVAGGAGFTLLFYKAFKVCWVETTIYSFEAQPSWRFL